MRNVHTILTEAEQLAVVNALAFYNDYWAAKVHTDPEEMEQWRMAFSEDNRGEIFDGPVDKLATKIATLY